MADSLVIIPTYNEKENIEAIIKAVFALSHDFDVLIVDDGSPDGTAKIVADMCQIYPSKLFMIERSGKLGLGSAYLRGFNFALSHHYEYIFEMDADFSHNPKDLILLYQACHQNHADLAIGSRYVRGVNVVNWPMSRVLMSYFASQYVRFITGMPIHDATAGFKCYKRELIERIDLKKVRFIGYAFQIEMKFRSWKLGFKIEEVPIIFTDRSQGTSKMSRGIFKEAIFGVIWLKYISIIGKLQKQVTHSKQ